MGRVGSAARAGLGVLRGLACALIVAAGATAQHEDAATEALARSEALLAEGRGSEARDALSDALETPLPDAWRVYLLLRRAEFARFESLHELAAADLDRAEALLGDTPGDDLLRAALYGIRGQIHLDRGLVDVAARWIAREGALVRALDARGVAQPADLLAARWHEAHLALAREDLASLEALVKAVDEDPRFDAFAGERLKLGARLGLALTDEAQDGADTASRAIPLLAAAAAAETLPPYERVRPRLALAELALLAGRPDEARAHLATAAGDMGGPPARTAHGAFHVALSVRAALAAGVPDDELLRLHDEARAVLDALVERWRATGRSAGYGPLQFADEQGFLGALVELELVRHGPEQGAAHALGHLLRVEEASSLARALGAAAPTVDELRDELLAADDHGVLVYLPGPWRGHVLVLARDVLAHAELPREDAIEAARDRLRLARARGHAWAEARALRELVLPTPVLQRLASWRRVTLVGLDLLGELPFEALPLEDGAPLGAALAVDVLPSLTTGVALARRARRATEAGEVWLLANREPTPAARALDPGLAALTVGEEALHDVLAVHGRRARLLLDGEATLAALRAPALGRACLLQVVAHGVQDPSRERPAGLVLAPVGDGSHDGLAFAEDLAELPLPPLVVLAACGAGRAPTRRGDAGAADLAGAALAAGARAVVLSTGDLTEGTALALTAALHEGLASGLDPAEALRRARRAVWRDDPQRPLAEEPLRVVGLGHEPVLVPAPRDFRRWIVGTLALLAVVAVLARARRRTRRGA